MESKKGTNVAKPQNRKIPLGIFCTQSKVKLLVKISTSGFQHLLRLLIKVSDFLQTNLIKETYSDSFYFNKFLVFNKFFQITEATKIWLKFEIVHKISMNNIQKQQQFSQNYTRQIKI